MSSGPLTVSAFIQNVSHMYCGQKLSERIYWTGVYDRRKHLFENMWPLPEGVSYNSYLIKDEKCALMDTVESGSDRSYLDWLADTLEGRPLDYLVIHHMELDHSGEIENLVRQYPDVRIVGNAKTFRVLEAYFGKLPNLVEVKDGDTLSLGYHNLKFVFTPWVHWPETMMSYDTTDGVLFSGDAFGMFGATDGGVFDDQVDFARYESEMRRYYSNIVGKYSGMVQKALAKLSSARIGAICPLHGLVWRSDPARVPLRGGRCRRRDLCVDVRQYGADGRSYRPPDRRGRSTGHSGLRCVEDARILSYQRDMALPGRAAGQLRLQHADVPAHGEPDPRSAACRPERQAVRRVRNV